MQLIGEIPTLSKGKLLLRPFSKDDISDMYDIWPYEDDNKYIFTFSPHINHEMRLSRIQNILDSYLSNGKFIWAIEYFKNIVGAIEVVDFKNDYSSCKISCYLSNELYDTSLLKESINIATDYLMRKVGIKNIEYKKIQTSSLTA